MCEGDAGTMSFDLRTGTWSRSGAEAPWVMAGYGLSPPEAIYDEAAERMLVIGWDLATYDAATDRWEVEPTESDVPSAMVEPEPSPQTARRLPRHVRYTPTVGA